MPAHAGTVLDEGGSLTTTAWFEDPERISQQGSQRCEDNQDSRSVTCDSTCHNTVGARASRSLAAACARSRLLSLGQQQHSFDPSSRMVSSMAATMAATTLFHGSEPAGVRPDAGPAERHECACCSAPTPTACAARTRTQLYSTKCGITRDGLMAGDRPRPKRRGASPPPVHLGRLPRRRA